MKNGKVLVIYSGWLGDLVWIIPAIHALKTRFHSVSMVVSRVQAPLAEVMKNGLIDDVYVDDPSRRLASARRTRHRAKVDGIQTFIDLKGRWKTGIYIPHGLTTKILIPHPADAREYALSRLLHPLARTMPARPGGHMVDAYLNSIGALDISRVPVSFALPFSERTVAMGERIVAREGLRSARSVSINPGSAQFSKIWPASNYRRLAEALYSDLGCKVVVMGAKGFSANDNYDLRISREFFGKAPATTLVEETDLAVDAYLLASGAFSVSIGNDSFAGHMAGSASEVASDTPRALKAGNGRWYRANRTVSLFAPTNPVFCRPYDPTEKFNTIVQPATYPSDCPYDRVSHVCPHYDDAYCVTKAHCMQNITVDQVVAAVEKQLDAYRKG